MDSDLQGRSSICGLALAISRQLRRLADLVFYLSAFGIITAGLVANVYAQTKSYWLIQGSSNVGACDGNTAGEPLRAANHDGQWILLTGVVTCRDLGSTYSYEISYLVTQINPSSRERINRETISFDWVGLAIYGPAGNGERINWIYDEALPIHGSLQKASTDKIVFGRLKFPPIPKADIARATNFTFYMTAEGPVFEFGLL